MSLTGDFDKVAHWAAQIGSLASGASLSEVSAEMAKATAGFIGEQFATGRDPFGNPWAPKKKPDGRPVGTGKTGRLKKYRVRFASASGFEVYNPNADYRRWFHGGRRVQTPRPISPGNRVPARWDAAYQRIWIAHCHLKLRAA